LGAAWYLSPDETYFWRASRKYYLTSGMFPSKDSPADRQMTYPYYLYPESRTFTWKEKHIDMDLGAITLVSKSANHNFLNWWIGDVNRVLTVEGSNKIILLEPVQIEQTPDPMIYQVYPEAVYAPCEDMP
jgi:hypothetical protein